MLREFYIYFPTYFPFLFANFIQNLFLPVDCGRLDDGRLQMNKYRSIASCIAQISGKELFWKPTVVLRIGENRNKNEIDFNNEMLEQIARNNVPYVVLDAYENGTLDITTASYLLVRYFDDCEALIAFNFDALETKMKYINVLDKYSEVCEQSFQGVENVVAKYDLSVFIKHSKDQYNFYTYIPDVNPDTCQIVINEPLKINSCTDGKLIRHGAGYNAFPRKVSTNLNKCPFKIGMGSLYPYAMIENRSSLQTYDSLDINKVSGMDIEIIKIMTKYFNATLDLYYIFKQEENPFVNVEYLPFLLNGSLEACAGGLYRIYGDVVEYSGIYSRQTIMWIYSAERVIRTWKNMVMSIDGLYLFIIFFLSYSVAWCLICFFDKRDVSLGTTLIYSWGVLVGTASLQDARSLKQKILNTVYLNMCLHLSVYISIQLFSFLTIQEPPRIFKTNDDVMNSGRTPFLRSLTKYFVKDDKYELFANTSIECAGFADCAVASLLHKGVTVYLQGYFYPFQAETAVNDEARMLSTADNLLIVYYEMIIRKESPLVVKFQKIIVRLFEAGITEKLYNEAIGLTIVGKAKIATKNMVSSSYACQTGCALHIRLIDTAVPIDIVTEISVDGKPRTPLIVMLIPSKEPLISRRDPDKDEKTKDQDTKTTKSGHVCENDQCTASQ